ncbi:MAG: nucleoside triphosphate pyrophosphohydrolase [Symploca sp. SIO2B6]|nr:nucleoside triphosphate pyrophosphohydrolase [Symploca sp. SIO2B6]
MANNMTASDMVTSETLAALQQLIDVVAQLRSPDGGCPWDLAQTPESLMPYVIEEAYEVVDAIRQGHPEEIVDELGDLLLQVVLQAQIASESEHFSLREVAEAIATKLIRRHPHVFGTTEVGSVDEVHQNWDAIKAAEEQGTVSDNGDDILLENDGSVPALTPKLRKYARSLPPLMAASKISKKAATAGFEWDSIEGVWNKFHEELDEFHDAIEHESVERQQAELGDLLFTVVNIARWYGLDPSEALQATNHRFIDRFDQVETMAYAETGRSLADYSIEELEKFWQAAKKKLANQAKP